MGRLAGLGGGAQQRPTGIMPGSMQVSKISKSRGMKIELANIDCRGQIVDPLVDI